MPGKAAHAGFRALAQDYFEDSLSLDEPCIKTPAATFCLVFVWAVPRKLVRNDQLRNAAKKFKGSYMSVQPTCLILTPVGAGEGVIRRPQYRYKDLSRGVSPCWLAPESSNPYECHCS